MKGRPATIKRYVYKTLGCLGQIYQEDGETEANNINDGSIVILASDYDALAASWEVARDECNYTYGYIAALEAALDECCEDWHTTEWAEHTAMYHLKNKIKRNL